MRCPECHTINEPVATVCATCGLLLMKLEIARRRADDKNESRRAVDLEKKRRAEDFATQKRRTDDQQTANCEFCNGTIASKAVRCKHCGEIVNADYYRVRAQRLRSRINYAAWVAYVFGLGALLVFRPVGILSIAAGMVLSIAYYAIPADVPEGGSKKRSSLWVRLKQQLKMERVSIPIPALKNRKLVFVGTPLIAALIGYSANLFMLQEPMNQVLKQNAAFQGMSVSAHYEYWIVPGVIVYDLRELSVKQTPIDVHTAFLEFAKKLKNKRYSRVDISYQGHTKFQVDGGSFKRVGNEYAKRNFDYVLYKFPRLFQSGPPASSDRDALLEFHRRWYGSDQLTRTVANGL